MGYFKNKIRKLINWAQSDDYANEPYKNGIVSLQNSMQASTIGNSNSIGGHDGGLNFTVYSATGGKVIQVRTYNSMSDVGRSTLYVINDKDDLGQELAHIITVERLSR